MSKLHRACLGLGFLALLSGCAPLAKLSLLVSPPKGLEVLTQKVSSDMPVLSFSFEFDDKADAVEGEVGSGYVVIAQDGKELQALPHAFELPRERLDRANWLQFKDFNGDGLLDFKVTRMYALGGQLPVETLYQFDSKTGRFAQVDVLSNAGEIQGTSDRCVSLKVQAASGSAKTEEHCYATNSARWVRGKTEAGKKSPAVARVDVVCDSVAPELIACRRARIEQDKSLLTLVREYRKGRMQALASLHGSAYAQAYARTQDLDHSSWSQFRDARCSAQSRERAIPVKDLPAAVELCRYDWSRDQLRRYKDQIARLSDNNKAKTTP